MAMTADQGSAAAAPHGASVGADAVAPARLSRRALLLWCLAGVCAFAALAFAFDPGRLTHTLGDTDDATRLIEVRELLAGADFTDMTLPRFGGSQPLVSHWSRIIDVPLAGLLLTFDSVMPAAQAELAVRALWPLLVLLGFVYLLARESELRGGRAGALIAIVLSVTCIIGIVQFLPGRIDHHNAIILCTVGGILLLARSFDDPRIGWGAGVLLGLGTAIGYEALALTATCLAAAALYGFLPGRSLLGPSRAAVSFAATLSIALSLTTAQSDLLASRCDALSINLVLLAAIGAAGVTVVQAFEEQLGVPAKLAILAAAGALGLAVYAHAEPACLAGPFGQVDPALFPVWLGSVSETQSMLSLGEQLPQIGGMALVYLLAGAYCGFRLMSADHDVGLRFLLIALFIAMPLSFWQIKLLPYATFLPIPLIAGWLGRGPDQSKSASGHAGLALIAIAVLAIVGVGGFALLHFSAPASDRMKASLKPVQSCQSTQAIAPLAILPKGLVVADVNLGPYVAALSELDAYSAPYHRLGKQIIETDRILHASPSEAERRLREIGATYVIVCPGLDSTNPQGPVPRDALQTLLLEGKAPAFLTPVKLGEETPLKVWRVKG
jgi:hypothetical protein